VFDLDNKKAEKYANRAVLLQNGIFSSNVL